jgi:predicted  nucleic acid-binding Zn-ribbon protein
LCFQLKERRQEVLRLRADVANANLKADKVSAEKDRLEKDLESNRSSVEETAEELVRLRSKVHGLESLKNEVIRLKEDIDLKDSEIEDKNREVEVLEVSCPYC